MLLAALLVLSSVDYGILSVTAAGKTEAACQNHTEHTADCGYVETVEGAECTHEHTDECYSTVTECVHEHGTECYEKALTCENAEEGHEHTDECYTEALICAHVCSGESGCISRELDCKHVHDESCGYVEAVEGQPCTHSCELCSSTTEEGTEPGTTDAEENLAAVQAGDGTPVANAAAITITSWADLQNAFQSGGDYVLGGDVESTEDSYKGRLNVPAGITVTLDLAGHKVDRSLDSPLSDGQVMNISGTLTVNDTAGGGVITGGYGSGSYVNAAAVYVMAGGSFTLNGGSISGNRTSGDGKGTGVAVADNATFIMNGGSICNNTGLGSSSLGGGVGADTKATVKLLGGRIENNSVNGSYAGGLFFCGSNVTVGGSIVIKDNTAKGGKTSNVKSSSTALLLSEEVPLTEDAEIGWTVNTWNQEAEANGTPVAKGKNAADYLDNFFSDQDPSYIIGVKEGDTETIYIATADSTVVSKPSDTPVATHEHDDKTFEPWSENNIKNLGNGNSNILEGSYYLTDDVKATTQLIASGIKVDICLNGHTFDLNGKVICLESGAELNIYDCDANGFTGKITKGKGDSTRNQKGGAFYVKSSTLNLYGGSLEENNADWGGAIFIDASEAKSTVNMYGGVIQNNTAQYGGGGIEVENGNSVFNMYGGSIVNNTVTYTNGNTNLHKGGGVHFAAGEMSINGKVNITGNQVAGKENNAYLRSGVKITIDLIEEGSRIGVSSADVEERKNDPVVITSGYGRISSTDIKYFFMDGTHDKANYALLHNGTELQIKAHSHDWKYVAGTGDSANKLYAYCNTSTPPQCGYYGETCTSLPLVITAQSPFTHTGSAYDGAKLSADELFAFNAATGNSLSDADIVYYTDADCTQKTTTANGAAGDGKAPVNEGTYYAAITVGDATAKAAFTIRGASAASVTVTDPKGLTTTFDGTAQALVTAGSVLDSSTSASAGTMEYQVAADASGPKDDGWSADIPTATKVGKYLVYYRAVVNSGYAPVDYTTSGYPSVEAEITKAEPDYTAPAAVSDLTYNGKSQQLITAGTTAHGTIQYSLDGTTWKTEVSEITGTKAGEYTVYWKLVGDANHENVAEQEIKVTIQKAEPSVGTVPECIIMSENPLSSNAEFDGYTMKGVDGNDLPGTFGWKDGTIVPNANGTQTAVFRPEDATNYKDVEVSVNVKIYYLPSAKITVKDDWWNSLLTTITFGIYHTEEKDVVIEGTVNADGGYDINGIYYYIDTTGSTEVLSAGDLADKWQEYDGSNKPKVKDPDKNVIYAKVTDEGGNAVIICSNGIIIDSQAPGAAVTINGEAYTTSDAPVVRNSADLVITIADQGSAGLQDATAVYQKAGEADGTDIALTDGAGKATITTPGDYTLTLNAKDKAGNAMDAQVYHFTIVKEQPITLTGATVKDAATGQTKTGYVKGDKVIITADEPEEGDVFDHWEAVGIELDEEQKKSSSITITIPDNGITISAVYRDATAPAISGIKDGGSYCGSVTVAVTDKNLDKVTVDGVELTPDANGRYTIAADNKSHVIEAKDAAGNSTTYKISVYEGHDFGNLVYSETGRDGDMITEEAPCAHGCDKKVVRKRTAEGDVISQEYPSDSGSNGSLATEVKVEAGTPATSVAGLNIEVAKAILNAAELSQVENGENLLVYLKVNKLGEAAVPAGDKTKTEEQAAAISNLKQGVYLDLSMWKKIGTADEVLLVNAETSQELKITVALPEELKAPSGKVRTYYVIRVHDGVVTVLPAELNGDELSFKTNMFSTYSIWYTENNTPAPPSGGDDTPGSPSQPGSQSTTNSSANSDVLAPKTGDESNMALWSMMLLLSAVVMAGITAKWKKDRGSVHN